MKRLSSLLIYLIASTCVTAAAYAYYDNGFWVDPGRLVAVWPSSSVEFGFDGGGRYVIASGDKRYAPINNGNYGAVGYKVNYSGSGRTQWLVFDFIGTNFFGSATNTSPRLGSGHWPIFMRHRSFQNSATVYGAEGKGIFLGPNANWGTCGEPSNKTRIFFETKIMKAAETIAAQREVGTGAVKCADWYSDKYFEDGRKYRLEMHVNDTHMAYWMYRADQNGNMVLWSSNGTEVLDYPYNSFNSDFWAAKTTWVPSEHYRMNNENIDTVAMALVVPGQENIGPWNLKITNLNAGRF